MEGVISQARKVAAAETLFPLTLIRTVDIYESCLVVIREQNAGLLTERHSLLYQLEAFKKEVSDFQKKAVETCG